MVLEKIPESPLDCKEIKPVNPKGNQPWIFIGRTDAEAEAPILTELKMLSVPPGAPALVAFVDVQSLSMSDSVIPWTAAHLALSFTIS